LLVTHQYPHVFDIKVYSLPLATVMLGDFIKYQVAGVGIHLWNTT